MKARIGKIARLPLDVRNELNRRIENGEPGNELVEWLNNLREVGIVLNAYFGGRMINAQNLSDWKAGGYQDWLAQRALQAEARQLSENAGQLAKAARVLPEHLVTVLSIRYAALLAGWDGKSTDEFERDQRSLDRLRQSVVALRQSHHRAIEVDLKERRFEYWLRAEELKRRGEKASNEAFKEMMIWSTKQWNKENPDNQKHYSFLESDVKWDADGGEGAVRRDAGGSAGSAGKIQPSAEKEAEAERTKGEGSTSIKANQGESSHAGGPANSRQRTTDEGGGAEGAEDGEQNIQQPTSSEGGKREASNLELQTGPKHSTLNIQHPTSSEGAGNPSESWRKWGGVKKVK